ncbi:MAG: TetR/AcrR family transcriptional regulator [Clostridiales bacterium]|nr:TetR/AcrR family transcriptional regulator [Clostridiales bacterium]MDD7387699.1 TetR/AcrR family transcriptional regulator [Bacillota bacterium]
MNKSESKYFNTAARMDEAFLELLSRKSFAYISVKEICEKAGVNRSTFYLHYETIGDLLNESMQYMSSQFLTYFKASTRSMISRLRDCPLDELNLITPEYLTPYLNYIRDHKRLFQTAVENASFLRLDETYDKMFRYVFLPILERYQIPEPDRPYTMAFYVHGLMAITSEWLHDDCADSIDHVIAVMQRCVTQPQERTKKA